MSQQITAIARRFTEFEDSAKLLAGKLAKVISDSYVYQIHLTGAIDTGRYLRSIDYREVEDTGTFQQWFIDSSKDGEVTYDGFVERGTVKMAARYPAQRGIESVDFQTHFNFLVDQVFA